MDTSLPQLETPLRTCGSCGFLATLFFIYQEGPKYLPVSKIQREWGAIGSVHHSAREHGQPLCIRDAADLHDELNDAIAALPETQPWDDRVREASKLILEKKRPCRKWMAHREGLTPDQHLEEMRMMDMEERQRKWDIKLVKLHKHIDDSRDKARASEDEKSQRMEARLRRRDWYLAIFLGVLTVASPFCQLFFPNGCSDLAARSSSTPEHGYDASLLSVSPPASPVPPPQSNPRQSSASEASDHASSPPASSSP